MGDVNIVCHTLPPVLFRPGDIASGIDASVLMKLLQCQRVGMDIGERVDRAGLAKKL